MSALRDDDFQIVMRKYRQALHIEEGLGTFGKREAPGVKRLYIEVKDEGGNVRYQSWQQGPLEQWERVTLYFDRYGLDASGEQIGISLWE